MLKKLAIYFSDPEPMGYPFNANYPYWEIYQGIIKDIEDRGIEVYIVRGDSYLGKGIFSHGWQVRDGKMMLVDQPITVDLIFNRDDKNTIPAIYDCPIINHPELDQICLNKVKTAELFPDLSPKTKAINSYQEFLDTVAEWDIDPEQKIVVKKNFLSGGQGIYIRREADISESLYENWQNVLMQEFIDTSVGIAGIVQGLHDIRIVTINREPVYSFIRIPPKDSFLANVSQGGSERAVPLAQLPSILLTLVERVNNEFVQYKPSMFAADFFNSKNGFKLIELNSRPAVCDPKQSSETRRYIDKIVQLLVGQLA
jgi:glutathione synthase/RimK-type ligase-like ATP-grasp enzyme